MLVTGVTGVKIGMAENKCWMEDDAAAQRRIDQARALKEQARSGGLRFEVYLTPGLAEWVLEMVERGDFIDPAEAVFVSMQTMHEMEPHEDLKRALLSRRIQAGIVSGDAGEPVTMDELMARIREDEARAMPSARWKKVV